MNYEHHYYPSQLPCALRSTTKWPRLCAPHWQDDHNVFKTHMQLLSLESISVKADRTCRVTEGLVNQSTYMVSKSDSLQDIPISRSRMFPDH